MASGKKKVTNAKKHVVTKDTNHVAVATSPDVCKVPPKDVPKPFPNWVNSDRIDRDKTTLVFIEYFPVTVGNTLWGPPSDPAHVGTHGGVTSGAYRGPAQAVTYSTNVVMEGDWVVRKDDLTLHNLNGDGVPNTTGHVIDAADLAREIKAMTGRAPPNWCAFLSGNNLASKRLADAMPKVSDAVNKAGAAAKTPISVTQAELASNFLAEGGEIAVNQGKSSGINGYDYAGIDTLLDPKPDKDGNYHVAAQYRDFLPPDFPETFSSGEVQKNTNDSVSNPATVVAPKDLTIEEAFAANAAIYASEKEYVATYLAGKGVDFDALPTDAQFYWTALAYNGGPGTFRSVYNSQGIDAYQQANTYPENWYSQYSSAASAYYTAKKAGVKGADLQKLKDKLDAVRGPDWFTGKDAHFNVMRRLSGYKSLTKSCLAAGG